MVHIHTPRHAMRNTPAAAQALAIARGALTSRDGSPVAVRADTLCVHGDLPGAAARARAVREALDGAGIEVRALGP